MNAAAAGADPLPQGMPLQESAQRMRDRAAKTAGEFEQLFVRTLVSSLRATSSLGGEGGGMFGSGPGADTYGDWFDQNLAGEVCATADIGIAKSLLADMERHGQVAPDAVAAAKRAADRAFLASTKTPGLPAGSGGIDVVLR
jgi:Rod binding domain-containing protein